MPCEATEVRHRPNLLAAPLRLWVLLTKTHEICNGQSSLMDKHLYSLSSHSIYILYRKDETPCVVFDWLLEGFVCWGVRRGNSLSVWSWHSTFANCAGQDSEWEQSLALFTPPPSLFSCHSWCVCVRVCVCMCSCEGMPPCMQHASGR